MKDKIWALMVHLSGDFSGGGAKKWMNTPLNEYFDESVWRSTVDAAAEAGMNTIVLEDARRGRGRCNGRHSWS